MLHFGQRVNQTDVIQVYYGERSGEKVPSRWVIFEISQKKITTLTSLGHILKI